MSEKRNVTVAVIKGGLTDDLFRAGLPLGAVSRQYSGYSVIELSEPEAEVRRALAGHIGRSAIGSAEIWAEFPELRRHFTVPIRRFGPRGPVQTWGVLDSIVWGDELVDPAVRLARYGRDPSQVRPFNIAREELFAAFPVAQPGLDRTPPSLDGKAVYIVDRISFEPNPVLSLPKGVNFFTGKDLDAAGLPGKIAELDGIGAKFGHAPIQLSEITGALVVDEVAQERSDFSSAMVSRILAAAAAFTQAQGRVVGELRIANGSMAWSPRILDPWHMPFRVPEEERPRVTASDSDFWTICGVLEGSDWTKFQSGKEDYRALSLETAADSRNSRVPALHYVQIWMAIERLVSFRHETTMHLAISLPALKPALDRPAEFRRIKDLYALRSEIAHGYAFKRSADIADATSQVAEIYRRLLRLSLARETSDALRQSLVDHVLEGTLLPVDSKAAVGGGDPDVEAYSELSERDVSEADAVLNGASATE